MEKIRKIIPFEVWQSEWLLRWLHEQSREGLELTDIDGNIAVFKPTTHVNLTYGLFSFAISTKEDRADVKKWGTYLRNQKLQGEYEADGWACVTEWQNCFFVMRRTRLDAVPPPDISKDIDENRSQARWRAIGTLTTLLLLILNMDLKRDAYPPALWWTFTILMVLALLGGLCYLPHVLSRQKEEVRPRDVSQEEYHRRVQRAIILFLLKSAVWFGNIIGLLIQIVALFLN